MFWFERSFEFYGRLAEGSNAHPRYIEELENPDKILLNLTVQPDGA